MRLIFTCPTCKKKSEVTRETKIANFIFKTLSCGHSIQEKLITRKEINPHFLDGRVLYDFQKEGVEFLRESNFRALIADKMGLGKTIQIISAIYNFPEELLPALILVKASLKVQWLREFYNATGILCDILESKSTPLGLSVTISSYDSLPNARWKNDLDFNTLVLDECQMIKNHDSKRTQEVRNLAKKAKYILAASGTPIKNSALEYFPILNILRPEEWPNRMLFAKAYTNSYMTLWGYKGGGLIDPERFKEKTKSYIIRRETEDVLPDLPKIRRTHQYCTMNESVAKRYQKEVSDFQDYMLNHDSYDRDRESDISNLLAYMNRMRHLTGFSKIGKIIDYIEEFLEDNPGEKITVFMHHRDVQLILEKALTERIIANKSIIGSRVLRLESDMDVFKRQTIVDSFKDDIDSRVLIAPTLACGEGINLQFCSTAIIGEREWNPANEEQAEGRFPRPGSTASSVNIVYVVALGSIDELFAEYVERKRQYMNEALKGRKSDILWNQSTVIKEIAEKMMSAQIPSWKESFKGN